MMNRIVLIGNGFDLAHKLATSYADFINWYGKWWYNRLLDSRRHTEDDKLCSFSLNKMCWWIYFHGTSGDLSPALDENIFKYLEDKSIEGEIIKSPFMKRICQSIETKGWVDIEKVYYDLLCVSVNESQQVTAGKLNEELEYLQSRLIEYLKEIDNRLNGEIVNAQIRKYMFEPIEEDDISIGSKDIFSMYMRDRDKWSMGDWQRIRKSYQGLYFEDMCDKYNLERLRTECRFLPDRIMLLDFNYTRTADIYLENADKLRFSVNHIHGTLTEPRSVIFGYGDELDDDYKALLKCNNNTLLRNIKSIRYTETDKYRKFLSFIESSPFQIYIMGHSCGNSDRTLLNTLFEHKNCVSIKPFYYVKADGTDNYLDIAQNISRNFTDMKLMRDRVVNREYCKVLS